MDVDVVGAVVLDDVAERGVGVVELDHSAHAGAKGAARRARRSRRPGRDVAVAGRGLEVPERGATGEELFRAPLQPVESDIPVLDPRSSRRSRAVELWSLRAE